MVATRIAFRLFLLVALATTASAQPIRELLKRRDFRFYAVIFGVTVNEHGKVVSFHVAQVTDAKTDSTAAVPLKVPAHFIAAAQRKFEAGHPKPKFKGGKPVEFFTYYFYAPDYPKTVITDLYLPPENQP